MKGKTRLLTALLGAALTGTALGQTISYLNATYTQGYWLIANPLDAGDGKNTVGHVFGHNDAGYPSPVLPDGAVIYKFNGGAFVVNQFSIDRWDDPTMSLVPGEGAFLRIPPGQTAKVTFVGEVLQGRLVIPIPQGFSLLSSKVPQEAVLTRDVNMPADTRELGFPAVDGDTIYRWRHNAGTYSIHSWMIDQWDVPPVIDAEESFFVRKVAAVDWVREFVVKGRLEGIQPRPAQAGGDSTSRGDRRLIGLVLSQQPLVNPRVLRSD